MSIQRNYYEVLGLPPGATIDEIKKKYRELARKFHPDVVQDKALGQRVFSQINQAYHVLGDPARRAQYNSTLNGNSAGNAAPVTATTQMRPAPAGTPSPSAAKQTAPAASPGRAAPSQTGTAQKTQAVSTLLANADHAIMGDKPMEARAFCAKVLEIDPRNARALELLGDALVQMGQREDAAVQYRNALKVAASSLIQAKLNRLEQSAAPTRTNPPQEHDEKPAGGLFGRFLGRK